jgi:hypothetical protein
MYAKCDALHNACVNVAGAGLDNCAACGGYTGGGSTHEICESNNGVGSCVIADISIPGPSCAAPGSPCVAAPTVSVTVSPKTPSVAPGATQQFTATVTGSANTNVDWYVTNGTSGGLGGDSTVGTITAAGLYTAPSTMPAFPSVFVTAVSQADSSKSDTATLTFIGPPNCTIFNANPGKVVPPQSSVLSWSCSGVNSCSIDHGVGSVVTSGNTTVKPTAPTSYTITCTGPGGSASKSTTVDVGQPGVIEIPP